MSGKIDQIMAEHYDEVMKAWLHADEFRRDGIAQIRGYVKKNRILRPKIAELGSGRGELTELVLREIPRSVVYAKDSSELMNLKIKENLARYIDKRLFVLDDGINYFGNNQFDIFCSCWTFHNISKDERHSYITCANISLHKNGLFLMLDKCIPDNADEQQLLNDIQKRIMTYIENEEIRASLCEHELRDLSPDFIMREGKLLDFLKIGFDNVKIDRTYGVDAVITAIKK